MGPGGLHRRRFLYSHAQCDDTRLRRGGLVDRELGGVVEFRQRPVDKQKVGLQLGEQGAKVGGRGGFTHNSHRQALAQEKFQRMAQRTVGCSNQDTSHSRNLKVHTFPSLPLVSHTPNIL